MLWDNKIRYLFAPNVLQSNLMRTERKIGERPKPERALRVTLARKMKIESSRQTFSKQTDRQKFVFLELLTEPKKLIVFLSSDPVLSSIPCSQPGAWWRRSPAPLGPLWLGLRKM